MKSLPLPLEPPPLAHRCCETRRGASEERGKGMRAAGLVVDGALESSAARRRAACGRIMFDVGIIAMECDAQASWPVAAGRDGRHQMGEVGGWRPVKNASAVRPRCGRAEVLRLRCASTE